MTSFRVSDSITRNVVLAASIALLTAVVALFLLHKPNAIVAHVGTTTLYEKDVDYEIGVENAYGNTSLTREVALKILVRDATEQEVAKTRGVYPTEQEIATFEEHADSATKAPDILSAVKAVFGSDKPSYERIYIVPKIVSNSLHTFFDSHPELRGTTAPDSLQKALTEVLGGEQLSAAAEKNGLDYQSEVLSSATPPPLPAEAGIPESKKDDSSAVFTALSSMKPGEVYPTIVEDPYAYYVLRLVSADKGTYIVEFIDVQKHNYSAWYAAEAARVLVQML